MWTNHMHTESQKGNVNSHCPWNCNVYTILGISGISHRGLIVCPCYNTQVIDALPCTKQGTIFDKISFWYITVRNTLFSFNLISIQFILLFFEIWHNGPEGYFRQNCTWMCLPDLKNWAFSIPIFCHITHPSVYHFQKKNTQFCSYLGAFHHNLLKCTQFM